MVGYALRRTSLAANLTYINPMMKTLQEFKAIYSLPLPELILKAAEVAKANRPGDIQRCTLLSIKTGGCPEDCGYCSQSAAHYETPVNAEPLMSVQEEYATRQAG